MRIVQINYASAALKNQAVGFFGTVRHLSLWGLCAALSVLFFYSLGVGASAWFLGALALGFEWQKDSSWRAWINGAGSLHLVLAVGLSLVSVVGATVYAQDQLTAALAGADRREGPRVALEATRARLLGQAEELQAKSLALPADWVSATLRYQEALRTNSLQIAEVEAQLAALPANEVKAGQSLRLVGWVSWAFWGLLAVLLEASLVASLASPAQRVVATGGGTPGTTPEPVSPEVVTADSTLIAEGGNAGDLGRFLQAAFVEEGKPLRGRRQLQELLKMSERRLNELANLAYKAGVVRPERGVGLFLTVGLDEAVAKAAAVNKEA